MSSFRMLCLSVSGEGTIGRLEIMAKSILDSKRSHHCEKQRDSNRRALFDLCVGNNMEFVTMDY